jgi:hypothetical protein
MLQNALKGRSICLGFEESPEFDSRIKDLEKRLNELKELYSIKEPMEESKFYRMLGARMEDKIPEIKPEEEF